MRKFLLSLLAGIPMAAQAQVATFEDLTLPKADTFYVNYSHSGQDVGFNDGGFHFPCVYDTSYGGYWSSGFSYSNMKDSVTSGFGNQYAAKPNGGHASNNYAVVYGQTNYMLNHNGAIQLGFYITNSTYAYNSMKNGDQFAKKFGGVTGNDSDYFRVKIKGYKQGVRLGDSVIFYLADYRFANNAQDYIVKDWRYVDLSNFGSADSVTFTLSSSDNGMYGMNTPAYFCMDDVMNYSLGVKNLPATSIAKVYPNPATDVIHIELKDAAINRVTLTDMSGHIVASPAVSQDMQVPLSGLPAGVYLIQFASASGQSASLRITKQ